VRRRLSVLVAATTSAVVLAFLIPLALLLRNLAEERALAAATQQSQFLLVVAGSVQDPRAVPALVRNLVGERPAGFTSLYLPGQPVVGNPGVNDPNVARARNAGASLTVVEDDHAVVYVASKGESGTMVARTAVSRETFHHGVAQATAILAGLGMLLLLAAMFAADRVGRRVSAPIRQLAMAAEEMRDGHLDRRVPERGMPEVVALGAALNRLAARVQQLLAAERDSVADLSHRLRTPVTALRLDTDSITDHELADRLRQHVSQLERTVDAIVHDARRPTRAGVTNACDVGKVVGERVAFWSALAEEQGRELTMALPERPLRARLDASDLSDVVDVLIDNVFAHTDEGVPLEVWVVPRADGAVVLTVEDGGSGLPQADVITRGSSGAGSTGLGMDIARRAANASGGSLELGRSRLGGALIRVVLGAADR